MNTSLYIHMPWCVKKCPYCDFNSHQIKEFIPESKYIKCLLEDFVTDYKVVSNRKLSSIFIGGGTPSLISPSGYKELLDSIHNITPINDIEITMEANPGALEYKKFDEYFDAGINRISIGAQSFNDDKLKLLGRIHKSSEILNAIELLHKSKFENFNIDIMYGLPEQSLKQAIYDLNLAIKCQPTHISWYNLTLEPNTNFYHNPPSLPDENIIFDMMESGQDILAKSEYNRYEVSAYSRSNFQCQHNLNYWNYGDYIGIGAGAHGKITLNGQTKRTVKVRHPNKYISSDLYLSETKLISNDEIISEFMLNAFRLVDGFSINLFQERTKFSLNDILEKLKHLHKNGLINYNDNKIMPTKLGMRFLNNIIELFME